MSILMPHEIEEGSETHRLRRERDEARLVMHEVSGALALLGEAIHRLSGWHGPESAHMPQCFDCLLIERAKNVIKAARGVLA